MNTSPSKNLFPKHRSSNFSQSFSKTILYKNQVSTNPAPFVIPKQMFGWKKGLSKPDQKTLPEKARENAAALEQEVIAMGLAKLSAQWLGYTVGRRHPVHCRVPNR